MLTIVQPENDPSAQEGSQGLRQGIDGQLDPGLSRQEAHGKGHSGVQVGPCTDGRGDLLAIACHRGKARIPHHLHVPRLWPGGAGVQRRVSCTRWRIGLWNRPTLLISDSKVRVRV